MLSFLNRIITFFSRRKSNLLVNIEPETLLFRKQCATDAQRILFENSLIDDLLDSDFDKDAATVANDWIDSPEVHIRENNNFDCTIDYFLSPLPEKMMDIPSAADPAFASANNYIKSMIPSSQFMNEKLEALKNRVERELETLMTKCANQKGGIAFAFDVLSAINDQNKAFLFEMNDERNVKLNINLPKEEEDLRNRCSLLGEKERLSSNKAKLMKKIAKEAEDIAVCKREILRREYAIVFFSWLERKLQYWAYTIKKTDAALEYIRQDNNIFLAQYLAPGNEEGVKVTTIAPEIADFVDFIRTENKCDGILELDKIADIQNTLRKFSSNSLENR